MKNKDKLKYYNKFQNQLRTITFYFFKKYRYSLKLDFNEIKQMVDLEFFLNFEKNMIEDKLNEKFLFEEIIKNMKNLIKKLYFTNKSGKSSKNIDYSKIENILNYTSYKINNNFLYERDIEKLTNDIDIYSGEDFYEESEKVIDCYVRKLNLTPTQHKFLLDYLAVDYKRKKLWYGENKIYSRRYVDNMLNHLKKVFIANGITN